MDSKLLHEKIDKEFYTSLPKVACDILDSLIDDYGNQTWFLKAWNSYVEHVQQAETLMDIKMPGYIFNEYIGNEELSHSDIVDEMDEDELYHYGIKRRSGRYPWGSGENPYQRSEDFYIHVNKLKAEGISETEIAKALNLENTTELRFLLNKSYEELQRDQMAYIKSAKADGKSNIQIAKELNEKYPETFKGGESTVRARLKEKEDAKKDLSKGLADNLKKLCDEKGGMIDVGTGVERQLNVSETRLKYALMQLEYEEGYEVYKARVPQSTNRGKYTTVKVLAKPGTEQKDIYKWDDIGHIDDYTTIEDGNKLVKSFHYPESMSSKRLKIVYAEDGGTQRDGLVQIRRGVPDLSLGESNYAQVRILVDGTHYIKGMAAYGEDKDFPDGVDVIFNSNKSKELGMEGALKSVDKNLKKDPNNPFGSAIKEGYGPHGGQSYYIDKDGNEKLSLINKRSDEADWGEWSKELPSQMLSKQPTKLIKRQLDLAVETKESEYEDILKVNNPTVRKQLLKEFSDKCDRASIDLKAAPFPGQKYQVILPIPSLKDDECYAPNYPDGAELALIRYPHGGTFEIPIVKVNNRNKEGKNVVTPSGKDAIGINMNVASQLSGADFDGDTVMVIPISDRVRIKNSDPLPGLKGFDPHLEYGPDTKKSYTDKDGNEHYLNANGIEYPIMQNTQTQMGIISNLITDMTIKGATDEEKARAVRHSMVVIDANKHKLDWKQSEIDNGISELKKKYQTQIDPETGKTHLGSATLISKAKSQVDVPERKEGQYRAKDTGAILTKMDSDKGLYIDEQTGRVYRENEKRTYNIDPKTGEKLYRETGSIRQEVKYRDSEGKLQKARLYIKDDKLWYKDKETGAYKEVTNEQVSEPILNTQKSTKMAEAKDAFELSSGYPQEVLYAQYANKMKALANEARKEEYFTKPIPYSPSARVIYKEEVESLDEKLNNAMLNAPRERHAQMLADVQIRAWKQENPKISEEEEMKQRTRLLVLAREAVGAKRNEIEITPKEYEAIQAGAITPNKLTNILKHCNKNTLKKLATPRRNDNKVSRQQLSRMKRLSSYGYTMEEIAKAMGISVSTVDNYLSGKEVN